jgi:ankyrin repeat protein
MPRDIDKQFEKLLLAKNEAGILKLVESGAAEPNDTFEVSGYKINLLPAALERKWDKLAVCLIERGVNIQGGRGKWPPILSACTNRSHDVIEALLAAGAEINVKAPKRDGEADYTPLMVSAEGCDLWAVRRLLKAGADAAAQTSRKETAIHYALMYYVYENRPKPDATDIVEALLEAGCPLLGPELHYAAYYRDVAMTKLLLKHGAPANVALSAKLSFEQDGPKKGDTALKVVERMNSVDAMGEYHYSDPTDARRQQIAKLLQIH